MERDDASNTGSTLGKLAYGALFILGVPALLIGWARGTASIVTLPALTSVPLGLGLIAAGLALMLAGMWALRVHGGGLPMNAFPPPRFVERGAYALVPHPIYVGFCGMVLGASIALGSASGLWLVTPLTALACAALVLGYERHDLERRFGVPHARSGLHLPEDADTPPSTKERLALVLLILVPTLALSALFARLAPPPDAISTLLPGEARWPVWPITELLRLTLLPALLLAIAVTRSRAALRRLSQSGLCAMALGFSLQLSLPLVSSPRSAPPSSMSALLAIERLLVAPSFPASHVLWAIVAASALAAAWPRARALVWLWALTLAASHVTTGAGSLLDALGGLLAGLAVLRARAIWEALRRGSERIANSWREWQLGPVRVINHGVYAGLGTAIGALVAGVLAGPSSAPALVLACLAALLCSAIWAQVVEGSSQLLRPYGFYGGVLGILLGAFLSPLVGVPTWTVLAAFSLAGPWVQSLGRLRCLVQGCCHGSPAPASIGIRYSHPRSRVCRLAHLTGVPIHPTPLYSILWNVVIALSLGRLWSLHAPLHLIGGLYLVLTGLGRFVEESFRGEPQTKIWAGLRLYQWIAVATLLIGIVVTIAGRSDPAPVAQLAWPPALAALVMGLVSGAALGLDFPGSKKRFSRLA